MERKRLREEAQARKRAELADAKRREALDLARREAIAAAERAAADRAAAEQLRDAERLAAEHRAAEQAAAEEARLAAEKAAKRRAAEMRRAAREAQKALLPPIPDHALTRRAANPFGLSVTLDVARTRSRRRRTPRSSPGDLARSHRPGEGPVRVHRVAALDGIPLFAGFQEAARGDPQAEEAPQGRRRVRQGGETPDRKSRAIQLATEDEKKAKAQAEHLKLQLADKEDETREVRNTSVW